MHPINARNMEDIKHTQNCLRYADSITCFIIVLDWPMCYVQLYLQEWAGQLSRYSDWLRARRSGDRIPVGGRFSAPVQTGPGAHPPSYTMGTGSFPGVESGRGVTLTPPPFQCRGHERVELYFYSTYGPYSLYRASVPVQGCTLPYLSGRTRVYFTFTLPYLSCTCLGLFSNYTVSLISLTFHAVRFKFLITYMNLMEENAHS